MGRSPTVLEAMACDLFAIQETHRVGEAAGVVALAKARRSMVAQLMRWERSGKVEGRNLNGLRRAKFGRSKAASADMAEVFRAIGRAGIEHVARELEKQQGVDPDA